MSKFLQFETNLKKRKESTSSKKIQTEKLEKGMDCDFTFDDPDLKVILLGDSAVGKSKLMERYMEDEFNPRRVRSLQCIYTTCLNIDSTHPIYSRPLMR